MSNDFRNIDELFRDKLNGFSPVPPEGTWENIRQTMLLNRRKGRMLFLRWAAAAAAVLLAIVTGVVRYSPVDIPATEIAQTSKNIVEAPNSEQSANIPIETPAPATQQIVGDKGSSAKFASARAASEPEVKGYQVITQDIESGRFSMSLLATIPVRQMGQADGGLSMFRLKKISRPDHLSDYDQALIAMNRANMVEGEQNQAGWKLGMHLSPGISSYSATHSDQYARNMTYTDSKPRNDVGGGFSVQYKATSRWGVETGIYYARAGDQSGNSQGLVTARAEYDYTPQSSEKAFNTTVSVNNGQLAMNSTAGVIRFSSQPENTELLAMPDNALANNTALLTSGQFAQVFDFIEIPVYARYRVIGGKAGVDLMGGINTGIVAGNNVFMTNHAGRQKIGATADISPVNFSATAGIGLSYALGNGLSVSLEPRANYYLHSINSSGAVDFRPWRIGLFTGLSYEF